MDGVMNTMKTPVLTKDGKMVCADQEKVFFINRLVDRTDCKVVLSSAWRIDPDWRETMKANGFVFEFLDRTPDYYGRTSRGTEIKDWLHLSGADQVDDLRYAILDDNGDMLDEQKPNFFKTNLLEGVTEQMVNDIEKHLTL